MTIEQTRELESLLDEMLKEAHRRPHPRFWDAVIYSWAQTDTQDATLRVDGAEKVLKKMNDRGLTPSHSTHHNMMHVYRSLKTQQGAKKVEELLLYRLKSLLAVEGEGDSVSSPRDRDKGMFGVDAFIMSSILAWAELQTFEGVSRAEELLLVCLDHQPKYIHHHHFSTIIKFWITLHSSVSDDEATDVADKCIQRAHRLLDRFVEFSKHSMSQSQLQQQKDVEGVKGVSVQGMQSHGFQPLRVSFHTVMSAYTSLRTPQGAEKAESLLQQMIGYSASNTNLSELASPSADSWSIAMNGWAYLHTLQGCKRVDQLFLRVPDSFLNNDSLKGGGVGNDRERLWVIRMTAWSRVGTHGAALMAQQAVQEAVHLANKEKWVNRNILLVKIVTPAMEAWRYCGLLQLQLQSSTVSTQLQSQEFLAGVSEIVSKVEDLMKLLHNMDVEPDMMALNKLAETYSTFDQSEKLFGLLKDPLYLKVMAASVAANKDTTRVLPPYLKFIKRIRNPAEQRSRLLLVASFSKELGIQTDNYSSHVLFGRHRSRGFVHK